ncbi:hypothetical protein BRARA_E02348 [Brassica rapa]|uniref:Protein CASP n=1 Tax=Brassica campestris TaxID=3711 RepID=A0A397ZLJ2_BRACM|nr:hypothetical protein BRARA_E02348 [Brassica rapa]
MEAVQDGSERDKTTPSSSSSSSSPIPVVTSFWKEFDLEKEKSILDEQGLRIAENQENSQKNRRKLAESTRDFKKASPEDKLGMFNSLLKGYQEEVDNITKRAKFGENAFLNIYQKLYEAPDPFPALASIAEQERKLSEVESENRKMKVELEEYRTEATHLKNQQSTIRRLEERNRQLEQQMEEKIKEVVEIKQRNLAEENQKTLELLKDRRLKEKIGFLTDELEKTKADNVKLYGKIRYVQDYNHDKVVSRGSKKYVEDLESGFSSDVESKYKKIYEDDINPFAAFSKKEREQRVKDLGIRDRITLSSGRFLLGNKYARTFAFFYTIGLHVLVFTCLYRMSALSYLSHGAEETPVTETTTNLPRGF